MQNRPITDIIRQTRILLPDDPLGKAAGLLRATGLPELPVINYGRVVGIIRESDLLSPLSDNERGAQTRVAEVMRPEPVMANKYMSLEQVADIFSRGEMAVLPVVDEYGAYLGLLARADVVGILGRVLRPQTVAGMATPLGVHLTTGTISAGPGSLGLFLTGVTLALIMFISSAALYGVSLLVQKLSGVPLLVMLESPALPVVNSLDAPTYLYTALQALLVLVVLRLSPLAGYHGAEHMVVHAMEQGEQIEPESVKQMPRVHPRCGTNLLAAASLFLIITTRFSSAEAVLVAMVILVLGWRTVGGYLQYYATTKKPNDKQVVNGVKAGNELLDKYQAAPNLQVDALHRIWNIGLLQTAGGLALTYYLLGQLASILHLSSVIMP